MYNQLNYSRGVSSIGPSEKKLTNKIIKIKQKKGLLTQFVCCGNLYTAIHVGVFANMTPLLEK
jgi:hypothetical protein